MKFISIPRLKLASEPTLMFQNKTFTSRDSPTDEFLRDVTIIGNTCFIVGESGTIVMYNPTSMEFELDAQSGVITTEALNGVAAYSSSNITAVGDKFVILGYDGTIWSHSADSGAYPDVALSTVFHIGVAIMAGGIDAVTLEYVIYHKGYYITPAGGYGNHASWTEVYRGGVAEANGISSIRNYIDTTLPSVTEYIRHVAVGDNGVILKSDDWGNTWSKMESPTTEHLRDVAFHDSPPGFAVGHNGTIIKFDGASFETAEWSEMPSPTTQSLYGITMMAPDEAYICGSYGLVFMWDGTSWTKFPSGISTQLMRITGIDPNFVISVGTYGMIAQMQLRSWPAPIIDSAGNVTAGHGKTIGITEGSEDLPLKQDATTGKLIIDATYEPSRGMPFCDVDNYTGNDITYQTLISYTIPVDHEFNLHSVEFTRDEEGHSEYRLTIAGTEQFADLNPTQNVALPLSPNKLSAGDIILLEVRSDNVANTINVDGAISGDIEEV